jgi:hypothetical protein
MPLPPSKELLPMPRKMLPTRLSLPKRPPLRDDLPEVHFNARGLQSPRALLLLRSQRDFDFLLLPIAEDC